MKKVDKLIKQKGILLVVMAFTFSGVLVGQTTTEPEQQEEQKEKKVRDSFKLYGGATFNNLSLDSDDPIDAKVAVGYNLGLSYKRGRLFYYELGARFSQRKFKVEDTTGSFGSESFSVSSLELPITGGLNITSFVDRLFGLRIFVSAIPSFTIGEDVDDIGLDPDEVTGFMFYGQAGLGIDIAVIFIETGFNFGFNDIVDTDTKAVPNQVFVNLGFRF